MTIGSDAVGSDPPAATRRRRVGLADSRLVRAVAHAPVTVRTKLLVGYACIAALLVLVGVLGLVALGQSKARLQRLGALQVRAAEYNGLQSDVKQLLNLLNERAQFTPNAGRPIGRGAKTPPSSAFTFIDGTIGQTLGNFASDFTVLTNPEPALFKKVFSVYLKLDRAEKQLLALDGSGKGGSAGAIVKHETALASSLQPLLADLATRTTAQTSALIAQNRRSFVRSRDLFIGVAAGSVFFALLLGFFLSWSLVAPLRRTEGRLAEIAAGDFSRHVDVPNRDEIGVLAANVNRMNDELERLYREVEAASRHKSDFLANMSHELRTPLNAIIGFSEVLREQMFGELNEKQLVYVDDVLTAGRHLLSLINDVLDLAKIEAGRMELDIGDVSIPDVLSSGMTMHGERASREGVALGLAVHPEEITIRADERRVRQVVFNLLSNAIKFTPRDGRVDVSARLEDGLVEVSVADTGTGIPPEELERIFEEFEQGTAASQVEGTGLGLPLSRKFVELHGGRLWAESEVGVGSTFRFTLPVEREA